MLIPITVGVGVATLILTIPIFFSGLDDFWQCVKYALTPDIISWLRGEWGDDWRSENRIFLWMLAAAVVALIAYAALQRMGFS